MANDLSIDPALLELALNLSGKATESAAVALALEEFVARRRHRPLLGLVGQLDWDPTFDVKTDRSREVKLERQTPCAKNRR